MMHKTTSNIGTYEQDEKELLKISILKRDLIKLLDDYESSRTGFTTLFFRDQNLTNEKLKIVDETRKFIKNFCGTKDELINELKERRIKNADTSRQYGKFHFNLMEKRRRPYADFGEYNDVKEGESPKKSGLAALFHEAIEKVTNFTGASSIRNNRTK